MKVGIIGFQNSGKTTVFNALTRSEAVVGEYSSAKLEPNIAAVEVEDPRVVSLSSMYEPKKTTFAAIDFMDFAGVAGGENKDAFFSGPARDLMKTSDALAAVLRNFESEVIDGALGPADPIRDARAIRDELVLSDLVVVEKRLERIEHDCRRGKKTMALENEEKILRKISDALDKGMPISRLDLTAEESRVIAGFQFLTKKPFLMILNSGEANYGKNDDLKSELEKEFDCLEFAGDFEMQLATLDDEEAEMFTRDMGIEGSAKSRLTRFLYRMLGLISFFTVGKDEVRAWTISRGDTAVDAAAVIHSDLARGFIRAECFSCAALFEAGSEKTVRSNGDFRLEGKNYLVNDGDILSIRFSV